MKGIRQITPPQNMSLWLMDYFELKAIENQLMYKEGYLQCALSDQKLKLLRDEDGHESSSQRTLMAGKEMESQHRDESP